jgi:hypothetical protein
MELNVFHQNSPAVQMVLSQVFNVSYLDLILNVLRVLLKHLMELNVLHQNSQAVQMVLHLVVSV